MKWIYGNVYDIRIRNGLFFHGKLIEKQFNLITLKNEFLNQELIIDINDIIEIL